MTAPSAPAGLYPLEVFRVTVIEALKAEREGYVRRGLTDRAAEVEAQIEALTGAGEARKAQPEKAARRGRQTAKG